MSDDDVDGTVLLPVETKTRELSAKLLLASVLAGRGYEVYLGNKIQHTAIDKINPDVYFELAGEGKEENLKPLAEQGVQILILETEGDAFNGPEAYSEMLGPATLRQADCYCAWGTAAAEAVRQTDSGVRVELTGNPRFDLLQEPYRSFYTAEATQLSEEYGDYILYNTNFSIPNNIEPIKSVVSDNTISSSYLREMGKKQSKLLGKFVRLVAETAERFPERSIVLRPHPQENISFYKDCFYVYDNVFVVQKHEVRPWILAADAVVHNSCTTGVTAAMLDTPVISYQPDGLETLSFPNEVSNQCYTLSEVCDKLETYVADGTTHQLSGDRERRVKRYIDNTDYLSVERIADLVDSLGGKTTEQITLPTDNKLRLRRALVRVVGTKRFEELYVKRLRGEQRQKYPYTPTEEVLSYVDRLADELVPAQLQVERVPYVVNGFRIWCDHQN